MTFLAVCVAGTVVVVIATILGRSSCCRSRRCYPPVAEVATRRFQISRSRLGVVARSREETIYYVTARDSCRTGQPRLFAVAKRLFSFMARKRECGDRLLQHPRQTGSRARRARRVLSLRHWPDVRPSALETVSPPRQDALPRRRQDFAGGSVRRGCPSNPGRNPRVTTELVPARSRPDDPARRTRRR